VPPCRSCNFPLPEPCAACPPQFFICPGCGAEQLLEASAEAVSAYLETRDAARRVRREIEYLGDMKELLARGDEGGV